LERAAGLRLIVQRLEQIGERDAQSSPVMTPPPCMPTTTWSTGDPSREADPEGERTAVAAAGAVDVGVEYDLYVPTARRVDQISRGPQSRSAVTMVRWREQRA
jgi:hypothetical protein